MLIIGHRGAAGLAFENSIGSLKKAQELGVDMVEVDLRVTRDNQLILLHDESLLRTHDDRRKVRDLTLNEVKQISIRENNEIPTLEEFLKVSKLPLNLELKVEGAESEVLNKIKKFSHKVLISSNKPTVLQKIRALDEKIPLGLVVSPKMGQFFALLLRAVSSVKIYSVHPHYSLINPGRMKKMKESGYKVFPWTVNNPHEKVILKGFGVDGIITDFPNLFKH